MAAFSVAATCSTGTLGVQWQRSSGGGAFAAIAGATATSYSFSTALGDSGAQFRAALDCGGQSATTSNAATLTVTTPGAVTSTAFPVVGTTGQAFISQAFGIFQEPAGSFVFTFDLGVKRLSADLGTITPVAGSGTLGTADGAAASASFRDPYGLTQDGAGTIYVADTGNHTIRRIASDGTVSTIAGLAGSTGSTDGTGSAARFNSPYAIALGPEGDLYVADALNHRIRRVTQAGVVTTYAGGVAGFLDGPALAAQFNSPHGIAVAANGDVLVADAQNGRVRRIVRAGNAAGAVETLAGNGTNTGPSPDGVGTAAVIILPSNMNVRGNTLTVLDGAGLLRQIDLVSSAVTTLTGSRTLGGGYADGTPTTARLAPGGVTGAANGGFMITDPGQGALRGVSATGNVRTIATQSAIGVTLGGTGVLAKMPVGLVTPNNVGQPAAVTVDPAGNVVIAEPLGQDVRRISPAGAITLVAGLTGSGGTGNNIVDGIGSEAQFESPGQSIASSSTGVLYVGDLHSVRRIGTDNATTLFAGSRSAAGAVDGDAATARFGNLVAGLAVAASGDVFVADPLNKAVRRIDAAGNVSTYAGALGQAGTADGPIATARLTYPIGLAFAPDGALLVADNGNLRRVAPDGSSISTLFIPTGANAVRNIAVDADGSVYWGGSPNFFTSNGLYKLAPGASAPTVVLPYSINGPTLGSAPAAKVGDIQGLALIGPKQLIVLTNGQIIKVTAP